MKDMKLKNLITESNKPGQIAEDFITPEEVLRTIKKVLGYEGHMDTMSGTLEWFKKDQDEIIYATPSWDGKWGIVPFDDEDGEHYGTLDFTGKKYFQNHRLQMKMYFAYLRKVLQKNDKRVQKNK